MEKPFKGFNHGKNKIDLRNHKGLCEMRPIEVHCIENGDLNNEPSFAIVMIHPFTNPVAGQISLKMWNDGLSDIGYEIVKKK